MQELALTKGLQRSYSFIKPQTQKKKKKKKSEREILPGNISRIKSTRKRVLFGSFSLENIQKPSYH